MENNRGVTLTCNYCGKEYEPRRKSSLYCSDKCRIYAKRADQKEFEAKPEKEKLSHLEELLGFRIDRTKAFTPEQQEKVNNLPRHLRYAAMARSNLSEVMTQEEIEKHYKSSNYPEVKYYSAGGGGAGSLTPNYRVHSSK